MGRGSGAIKLWSELWGTSLRAESGTINGKRRRTFQQEETACRKPWRPDIRQVQVDIKSLLSSEHKEDRSDGRLSCSSL